MRVEDLDRVIKNAEKATVEEPLHTIMQLLRRVEPRHPLLSHYRVGIKQDQALKRSFLATATRIVNNRLQDVFPIRTPSPQSTPENPLPHVRAKQHMQGAVGLSLLGKPLITWQNLSRLGEKEREDLLDRYQIGIDELQALGRQFGVLPHNELVQLCEVAVWLTMHDMLDVAEEVVEDKTLKIGVTSDTDEGSDADLTLNLQQRIFEEYILSAQKRRKLHLGIETKPGARRIRKTIARLVLAASIGYGAGLATTAYIEHEIESNSEIPDSVAYNLANDISNASWDFNKDITEFMLSLR